MLNLFAFHRRMKGGRKRSRSSTVDDAEDRHERLHASTRRGDHRAASQAVEASAPSPSATPAGALSPCPSATPPSGGPSTTAPSGTPAEPQPHPTPVSPMVELPLEETSGEQSSSEPSGEESASETASEASGEEEEPLILQEEIDAADVVPDVVPEGGVEGGADDDLIQRVAPFPGGPADLSLLAHYPDHKAPWTWQALLRTDPRYVDRRTLRVATVGGKVWNLPCDGDSEAHTAVRQLLQQTGLYHLPWCGLPETDPAVVLALVEIWHEETSSFHMPFGEMTITLDDVSAILHLPTGSRFYTPGRGERDEVAALCAQLLGGSVAAYLAEFEAAGGQNIRFITLKTMYTSAMDGGRYEDAARIWLVNQLGATLFASKSGGYHTTVYWIGMLEDLGRVSEYAWGAIALASLYEQLSRASRRKTAQIGGFTSLVLSWAYEYISSSVIIRTEVPGYTQDQPRAQRWSTSRIAHSGLDERRVMLDELTVDDITWTPFEDHRDVRPRDPRALYSGYIRTPYGRSVSLHLPERVMRQFGFIQDIPRHPSEIQTTGSLAETADAAYAEFEPHLRPQGIPATYPGEAVEGYMRWYSRVSHVFIIPEDRREELSAVSAIRRGVELLEQSLEVPGAYAPGTQPRILTERALDLFRRSSFVGTQGVAFSAIRGAAAAGGRARGGRARGGRPRGGGARGGRARGEGDPGEGVRGGRARGPRGRRGRGRGE
ncbi:protein MAIN-LIKE 1-like [Lotus japonicus]|uniref:protein MAIN-LIKE 1-like n=1 Tax=Lotus japonicus TaxID=34305 RepID=UPI00258A3B14|nr:protein MAIN-LIKE 1-like [Lotus japonicus]